MWITCKALRRGAWFRRLNARLVPDRLSKATGRDAIALLVGRFLQYSIPLVLLPYLARSLGAESFGRLLIYQSAGIWLGSIVEFGQGLTGTRAVAQAKLEGVGQLAAVVGELMTVKLWTVVPIVGLGIAAAVLHSVIGVQYRWLLWVAGLGLGEGLFPAWYYQGVQKAWLGVLMLTLGRVVTLGIVLIGVHSSGDGITALAAYALGALSGTIVAYGTLLRSVSIMMPTLQRLWKATQRDSRALLLRASLAAYSSANPLILGLWAGPVAVANFGGAERIVRAAASMIAPVGLAVYPRLTSLLSTDRPGAEKLLVSVLLRVCLVAGALSVGIWLARHLLVKVLLGPGYGAAVTIIAVLSPIVVLITVSDLVTIRWLLALGRDHFVVVFMTIVAIGTFGLAYLLVHTYGGLGMAWTVLVVEIVASAGGMIKSFTVQGRQAR